jgi:hypothetical protein
MMSDNKKTNNDLNLDNVEDISLDDIDLDIDL